MMMQPKIKKGCAKLREAIMNDLARKGMRIRILIRTLVANDGFVRRPTELDAVALELRHLAFQVRYLRGRKTATEEI